MATRKRRAVAEEAEEEVVKFDFKSFLQESVDDISRRQNFESSSLESLPPMSTGMLALDLVYGGGIRPGMMTHAGDEQTAKTTGALTIMGSAIKQGIPLCALVDYEGCLTEDTLITHGNGEESKLSDLFDLSGVDSMVEGSFIEQYRNDIHTLVTDGVDPNRKAQLYYRGRMDVTEVVLEDGKSLRGYSHPCFVFQSDGSIVQKNIEDLEEGDLLLVKG